MVLGTLWLRVLKWLIRGYTVAEVGSGTLSSSRSEYNTEENPSDTNKRRRKRQLTSSFTVLSGGHGWN